MESTEKSEKAIQTYAALGVGLVCILVGVPLWWQTTTVYRVPLPYSEISELAESQISLMVRCRIILPHHLTMTREQLQQLEQKLETYLHDVNGSDNPKILYDVDVKQLTESSPTEDKSYQDLEAYTFIILPVEGAETRLTLGQSMTANLQINLSHGIESVIPLIGDTLKNVLVNEASLQRIVQSVGGIRQHEANKETMRRLGSSPAYDVTFTLLNPQPDQLNVQWDIEGAIKMYLDPFLNEIKQFAQVTVSSQYLYYTNLYLTPKKDTEQNVYFLRQDDLPHIINPIESHLGSHVSNNPQVNFIVYVPTRQQSPLHIYSEHGKPLPLNAFLSPRWGGLMIYNVANPSENVSLPYLLDLNMQTVMEVFLAQLRLLLGYGYTNLKNIEREKFSDSHLAKWELQQWLRNRILENVATATNTLHSLTQLLDKVRNMVIKDDIGKEIEHSVHSIKHARLALSLGQLLKASQHAKEAIISSEKAFFDPSLLELLYFPEDQKFAIYIPLFLPISIPVVMSLFQAVKYFRTKSKQD